MNTPEFPNEIPSSSKPNETPELETVKITSAIRALLQSPDIMDPIDRKIIEEAASFIESPVDDLTSITMHIDNIGAVCAGYMMQGNDVPREIDAMHKNLLGVLYKYHIAIVQSELQSGFDQKRIQLSIATAVDAAKVLASQYDDNGPMEEAQALQAQIAQL